MNEHTGPGGEPGGRAAMPPIADTHRAKVDTFVALYDECVTLDGDTHDAALRKVIEQAVPRDRADQQLTAGAFVILAVAAVFVLAFLIPAVMWCVGNVIIPLWSWGTAWA